MCGKNESLTFHHIDSSTKRFDIGSKLDTTRIKLIEETNKCIVLCRKCHVKLHSFINRVKKCSICGIYDDGRYLMLYSRLFKICKNDKLNLWKKIFYIIKSYLILNKNNVMCCQCYNSYILKH